MRYRMTVAVMALAGLIGFESSSRAAGEKYFTQECLKQPTAKCVTDAALANLLVIDTDDKMVEVMMPGLESYIIEALAAAGSLPQAYEYAESLEGFEEAPKGVRGDRSYRSSPEAL